MGTSALSAPLLGWLLAMAQAEPAKPLPAPAAGEVIAVAGTPLAAPKAVDGTWVAGPCRTGAPLPAGYPRPTPPDAIELKSYPVVRKAEATSGFGPEVGRNLAFWKLFQHIQTREIAMTAPVEMKFTPKGDAAGAGATPDSAPELAGWTMAFLYREPTMGRIEADGSVAVVDDPPLTVLALGLRGDYSSARVLGEAKRLREALAQLPGWRVAGDPRALFYNGPEMRPGDKWAEIQLPVERVPEPPPAPAPARKRRVVI